MLMTAIDVRVTVTHGTVPRWGRRYLAEKIRHVVSLITAPVFAVETTLGISTNPAVPRPVTASAVLDINGRPVRAHVTATDVREAADLLAARLQRGLEHHAERRRIHRRSPVEAVPGEWRHGMLRHERPSFHPRPAEERELIARWSFTPRPLTPEEAIAEMGDLDHAFLLFTERSTGTDALVERTDHGVQLTLALSDDRTPEGQTVAVPAMEVSEAVQTLDEGRLPRLFFIERATQRGAVVYHRYDGHYGLVTTVPVPAGTSARPTGTGDLGP
jgi:ribosome-associated translation inhibitor RaiA